MKLEIFFLLIVSFILKSNAQTKKVDSLYEALKNKPSDTSRVKIYNRLASELLNHDLTKSLAYSDSAISLGMKINFTKGALVGLRLKGISLAEAGNHIKAKKFFFEGLSLALKSQATKEICTCYSSIANVSNTMGDYDSAIFYAQRSLACDSSDRGKKRIYIALATAYRQKNDYTTALSYHTKNLRLCKKTNDKVTEAKTLINIGNVYASINQLDDALVYFKESVKIVDTAVMRKEYANLNMNIGNIYAQQGKFSDAEKYYKMTLNTANYFGLKYIAAQTLCNIGNSYMERCLYQNALQYYSKSKTLATEARNSNLLVQLHIGYANSYLGLKKMGKAIHEAKEALAQSEKIGAPTLKANAYEVLSKIDSAQGSYLESLENFKKSKLIADSVFNVEKSKQLIEIKEKYEAEKKLIEIEKLQEEIDKKQAQMIQQRYRMYALLGITTTALSLLFLIHYRMKTKRESVLQMKILQKHKEVLIAQEETHKKISRDLHDNIGQKMIALKMNIEATIDSYPVLMPLMNEITADIRNISHTLSPHILQTDGLKIAFEKMLKSVFAKFQGQHLFETFQLKEKYPYEIEINLYRIGQELAANIIKHSKAKQVNVQLYESASNLVLIFEDDGIGFDPDAKTGFGLKSVENRVQMLKGVFYLGMANARTNSTVRIPI